jgi:predicted nucleotidyltransferase
MDISYVEKHTIFETVVGSRAYGIHNDTSDHDKSGVMIPGIEYFYGLTRFDQFQGYPDEDKTIYDIRKALRLISDNNPNMMDLLWVPERCVIASTHYWDIIREHRSLFVSKRCRYTFSGYAIAQLERIKTHRKFLLDPPKQPPSRQEYGLPEESFFPTSQLKAVCYAALEFIAEAEKPSLIDELDGIYGDYVVPLFARFLMPSERGLAMEWLQMGIKSQAKAFLSLGTQYIKDEYLDMAHKELAHYNASQTYARYSIWKKSRNKARAPLEEKFGYDSKHAGHLVRLMRMGEEILRTGEVHVDRTDIDAEELKSIRNGAWSYEQIEEYTQKKDKEFDELYKTTGIPRSVDPEKINKICIAVVDAYHRGMSTPEISF